MCLEKICNNLNEVCLMDITVTDKNVIIVQKHSISIKIIW